MDAASLLGLVVPGGWAPDKLRRYKPVLDLVRAIDEAGKPLGIICHGGLVPISAGILRGHKATARSASRSSGQCRGNLGG